MAYTPQEVTLARYEPKTFRVTMSPATNATGWTFSLNIRSAGTSVLAVTTGWTIEDASLGIFKVTLTSAQTGALSANAIYDFDIWRTNSGTEAQLVFGFLRIASQQWQSGG